MPQVVLLQVQVRQGLYEQLQGGADGQRAGLNVCCFMNGNYSRGRRWGKEERGRVSEMEVLRGRGQEEGGVGRGSRWREAETNRLLPAGL